MPRFAPFALMLLLAACSQGVDESDAAPVASETSVAAPESPGSATPAPSPGATLPAPGDTPRYAGRWASRADLCTDGAWVFTRDGFAMEDGPSCTFAKVRAVPGGYDIDAECESGGATRRSTVILRFAESAQAMLVEGLATLPDTGLVYCGPPPPISERSEK